MKKTRKKKRTKKRAVGEVTIRLHKLHPGDTGKHEATYRQYGRVTVDRGKRMWRKRRDSVVSNTREIRFPPSSGGCETLRYLSVYEDGEATQTSELWPPLQVSGGITPIIPKGGLKLTRGT